MKGNRLKRMFLGAIVYLIVFQNFISKIFEEIFGFGEHFGAIFILLLYALFFVVSFGKFLYRGRIFKKYSFLALIFIGLFLFLFTKAIFDLGTFSERILGFINDIFYASIFLFVYLYFRDKIDLQMLVNSLINAGVIAGLIGIAQFLFQRYLPVFFLDPYKEHYFITFGERLYVRPNGLIGNSIIYAHFMVLIGTLLFSRLVFSAQPKDFIKFTIVLLANILVFSRSTPIGSVFIIIIIYALGRKMRYFNHKRFFRLVTIGLVLVVVLVAYPKSGIIISNKFINLDYATKMSTIYHMKMIEDAIDTIESNPLLGVGIGTQGPSSKAFEDPIITDGCWFILLLEIGIPLFVIYVLFLLLSYGMSFLIFLKTNSLTLKYISLSFIAVSTFFYIANFVNSAFIGKVNFISYWLIFGIILAYYRTEVAAR